MLTLLELGDPLFDVRNGSYLKLRFDRLRELKGFFIDRPHLLRLAHLTKNIAHRELRLD